MKKVLGYIQGDMRREEIKTTAKDVEIINSLVNPPPLKVQKDDIYVRRCRLASDAVDSGYGRFRTDDIPKLLELLQGVSLLIGHKKDTVGVARFFNGSIEQIDDVPNPFTGKNERITYIVPKFYWMKKHSKAEDLRINIDGGIYHQVSLSWWYKKATCGICGKDMRECEHVPGRKYDNTLAFYYYDGIGDILEGSIVFKGGQPYTGFYLNDETSKGVEESRKIYRELSSNKNDNTKKIIREDVVNYLKNLEGRAFIAGDIVEKGYSENAIDIAAETNKKCDIINLLPLPFKNMVHFLDISPKNCNMLEVGKETVEETIDFCGISSVEKNEKMNNEYYSKKDFLKLSGSYIIEPLYEGVLVQVHRIDNVVKIFEPSGEEISDIIPNVVEEIKRFQESNMVLDGVLLPYRGRTRLGQNEVCKIIYNNKGPDDIRLKLKVFDFKRCGDLDGEDLSFKNRRESMSEVFEDKKNIQIIKGHVASTPSAIIAHIEKYGTKEGAVIKDAFCRYNDRSKWFSYKRKFEIDAEIVNNNISEFKYTCAVTNGDGSKILSEMCEQKINLNKGDIVRIEVDDVNLENDNVELISPKIIGVRYDRRKSDDFSVVKRISESKKDTDIYAGSLGEFMVYEHSKGDECFFEMLIQNKEGFMKFTKSKEFLFGESGINITESKESLGSIPSNSKILDYGYILDLKDSKHLKRFSLYGKFGIVKGSFIAREIVHNSKHKFLIWKSNL